MQRSKIQIKNNRIFNFLFVFLIFDFCILIFNGCSTAPYISPTRPVQNAPGIYHRVERGQTLWRISKMYGLDVDAIASVNHMPDTASIEVGQMIFIPNRQKSLPVPVKYSNDDFIWPLKGRVVTAFAQNRGDVLNKGLNISPERNPEVIASRAGKVVFLTDELGVFGKTVIIDHGDGFSTVYARNSDVFAKLGDRVEKGMVIARAGSSGRDKGVYLHFEIRKGSIPQNPYYYLAR